MKVVTFINTNPSEKVDYSYGTIYPRSFAYQVEDIFVNVFEYNAGFTTERRPVIYENANGGIDDWIKQLFSPEEFVNVKNEPGEVVEWIWRPGLNHIEDIDDALNINANEFHQSSQALLILLQKLNDLLLYIEPSDAGLNSYSHKTRELLLLACTEVENTFLQYINRGITKKKERYTTSDFIKLLNPLCLAEYSFQIKGYDGLKCFTPFSGWDSSRPTKSLSWYDAYNKTKHNRTDNFHIATLESCINAIAANVVLFCVKYSPFNLVNKTSNLSSIFNQSYEISLMNPDPSTFYVPKLGERDRVSNRFHICGGDSWRLEKWNSSSFVYEPNK